MENSAIANDSCSNVTSNNSSSCKMYKGVRKRKWGKWVSEIRLPNSRERIWLGSYDTQEKAARAFDAALYCLRGKSANFNFPNTPLTLNLDLNVPNHSLTHQEIQEVAAKFANDPPLESVQEEQSSESQSGVDSFGLFESNNTSNYDGTLQVDHDTLDWTFFNTLDDLNNEVAPSDFGLYFGPEKMHLGELLLSTQQPLLFDDNNGGEFEGDDDHDAFSNHSFLWSWNF